MFSSYKLSENEEYFENLIKIYLPNLKTLFFPKKSDALVLFPIMSYMLYVIYFF